MNSANSAKGSGKNKEIKKQPAFFITAKRYHQMIISLDKKLELTEKKQKNVEFTHQINIFMTSVFAKLKKLNMTCL